MTGFALAGAVACGAGAVAASLWPGRSGARRISMIFAMAAAAAALGLGVAGAIGVEWTSRAPDVVRPLGGLAFRLDRLGAWFLIVIGLTSLPAAIYAIGYGRDVDGTRRGRLVHASFCLFVGAMALVPLADNVVTFLIGWELMAVASYLLVASGGDDEETQTAAVWYAVMSHIAFLALAALFFTMAPPDGALDFAALRAHAPSLTPGRTLAVFVLACVAFGSKAGLVPLHVWLPRAHPAAPSHASALMSGAMVALGVYGAARVLLDLLPASPPWWGGVILTAGVFTAITGVLYSVAETHLKRVLAYSTIENMGLSFVSLGFALLMRGYGYQALAALGLVVALLHTLNHAAFKSLLFLGAGAVVHGTGESSLEAYGGLIKRMPITAVLCLIGLLAQAALPPLNGFPSEWLTFQVLVAGARHTAPELAITLPLAVAGVALTAGLAAASAVRVFGITFLALPRTSNAASAHEAPRTMLTAMAVPAIGCVALGLAPWLALAPLQALAESVRLPVGALASTRALSVPLSGGRFMPVVLTLLIAAVALAIALVLARRRHAAPSPVRIGPIWNCGRLRASPRSEYTAAAFAEPVRRVFGAFYQPTREISVDSHPVSPYFVRAIAIRTTLAPWMEQRLYAPVVRLTMRASARLRDWHAGPVHFSLALLPAALVAVLLLAHWIRR